MRCSWKKLRYFLLAALIFLSSMIVGCEDNSGNLNEERSKVYVAVIAKSTTSTYWKSTFAGANAAGTEYNLELTFEGPENEEDYETQNEMIYAAIENGADAIVISAVDYNANAQAVEEAVATGVKVVVIDSDVNSDKVSCRISTDNYKAGQMVGEAVLAGNESILNVGIVNFDKNSENGQQREKGFRDYVADYEHVNIVASINVNSTIEDAKSETIRMLRENPQMNVLVTFNEWTSLGVGYAVEELSLANQTRVVAFDSNVISVGMLETGEVDALIVQNPYAMGYLGVESAWKLVNEEKLASTEMDTTTTLITRDNMFDPESQKVLFSFD